MNWYTNKKRDYQKNRKEYLRADKIRRTRNDISFEEWVENYAKPKIRDMKR